MEAVQKTHTMKGLKRQDCKGGIKVGVGTGVGLECGMKNQMRTIVYIYTTVTIPPSLGRASLLNA